MRNYSNQWRDRYDDYREDRDNNPEWRPTRNQYRSEHNYNEDRRYGQYTGGGFENEYNRAAGHPDYGASPSYGQRTGSSYDYNRNRNRYGQSSGYSNYDDRRGQAGSSRPFGNSGYSRSNYDSDRYDVENSYNRGRRYGSAGYGSADYGSADYEDRRGYDPGVGYNRNYHRPSAYDRHQDYQRHENSYDRDDRDFFDKAGDEIASWFGDDEARRRREMDQRATASDSSSYRGKGPKNYKRSDDRIREDVSDRLSDDWHIDASDIEVTVENGDVILSGSVNHRFAKRHAEDLAERVSGVGNVENRIRVNESDAFSGLGSATGTTAAATGTPASASSAMNTGTATSAARSKNNP